MVKALITILLFTLVASCQPVKNAEEIISRAIETHGGENFDNVDLSFDFRDIHYTVKIKDGLFEYTRIFKDSVGTIRDVYSNQGFSRYRNGEKVELTAENARKYQSSVNSVIYFFLLPYKLDDQAVNATLVGETTIEGEPYYEIKVTFDQEGGGKDYDDVFTYWIHRESYTMDYLGYLFHVDGGGTRFRKAINRRKAGDLLLADYLNYKGPEDLEDIPALDSLYEAGQLEKLSEISVSNLQVSAQASL